MKLNNVHGFKNIDAYVKYKIEAYSKEEKNFETLFDFMFDEADNTMAETSDGYRIQKITYGEYKQKILDITPTLARAFAHIPQGEMVGLYMQNCIEWLQIFWAILAAGYRPLVMNTRLSDEVLEGVLSQYSVKCVVSDGKCFSVKTVLKDEALVPSEDDVAARRFGDEVIFMSSGTTNNVKLCAYNGENFYYQICDSAKIIEKCPKIKQHYEGELKQLILLPFCHVFGFIAVYLWFGFFSRTFVFPRDLNPETIQRTVKKHKVTHIFAVPMVWEAVHKAALRKIKERGNGVYKRFCFASKAVNRLNCDFLAKRLLGEVREGLFGDSIQFLITGGSHIKKETLSFFNGIGYHLVNGYGMTEIGITSVEKSSKKSAANKASIGAPFGFTEYTINEAGVLLVRGATRASRIMQNGAALETDYSEWFSTGDLMRCVGGKYYFDGRVDDLIVLEDGENINPVLLEAQLQVNGADRVCLVRGHGGVMLIASVQGVFSDTQLKSIYAQLQAQLLETKLSASVKKILFTHEALLRPSEFKLNRRKLAQRIESGELSTFDVRHMDVYMESLASGMETEIAQCFAQVLGKELSAIGAEDDFFRDLEGTSLDYFALLGAIKSRLGVEIVLKDGEKLSTVRAFADYVRAKIR
ncbi:MAG: AMP-binding protein [Clostridia bacterium]|nr:AMP-binding protein [Clostridia bacterium]